MQEDAKDAFKQLLRDKQIGSDATWDQAMRLITNDSRWPDAANAALAFHRLQFCAPAAPNSKLSLPGVCLWTFHGGIAKSDAEPFRFSTACM